MLVVVEKQYNCDGGGGGGDGKEKWWWRENNRWFSNLRSEVIIIILFFASLLLWLKSGNQILARIIMSLLKLILWGNIFLSKSIFRWHFPEKKFFFR